jgi:arginase family enzyme
MGVDAEINRQFGQPNAGAAAYVRRSTANVRQGTVAAKLSDLAAMCGANHVSFDSQVLDVGLVNSSSSPLPETLMGLAELCGRLKRRVGLIACDHTASFWFVSGLARVRRFHYVYLDAHLDLGWHNDHDHSTTQSPHNGSFVSQLVQGSLVDSVTNIGARSAATYDPCYAHAPFNIVRWPDASTNSLDTSLRHLVDQVIYLSIDMDVLDPSAAPNVSCPEAFGPSAIDLFRVVVWLATHCTIVATDLCELVPEERLLWPAQIGTYVLLAALNAHTG